MCYMCTLERGTTYCKWCSWTTLDWLYVSHLACKHLWTPPAVNEGHYKEEESGAEALSAAHSIFHSCTSPRQQDARRVMEQPHVMTSPVNYVFGRRSNDLLGKLCSMLICWMCQKLFVPQRERWGRWADTCRLDREWRGLWFIYDPTNELSCMKWISPLSCYDKKVMCESPVLVERICIYEFKPAHLCRFPSLC